MGEKDKVTKKGCEKACVAREGDGHNGKREERETEGSLFSSVQAERKTQGQETGWMNV